MASTQLILENPVFLLQVVQDLLLESIQLARESQNYEIAGGNCRDVIQAVSATDWNRKSYGSAEYLDTSRIFQRSVPMEH